MDKGDILFCHLYENLEKKPLSLWGEIKSVLSIFLNTYWKLRGRGAPSRFNLYQEHTSAVSTCAVLLFLGMPLLQYVFLDSRRSLAELPYS